MSGTSKNSLGQAQTCHFVWQKHGTPPDIYQYGKPVSIVTHCSREKVMKYGDSDWTATGNSYYNVLCWMKLYKTSFIISCIYRMVNNVTSPTSVWGKLWKESDSLKQQASI